MLYIEKMILNHLFQTVVISKGILIIEILNTILYTT